MDTEGQKKDSPIKNTDESSLVAGSFKLSNKIFLDDFKKIIAFVELDF